MPDNIPKAYIMYEIERLENCRDNPTLCPSEFQKFRYDDLITYLKGLLNTSREEINNVCSRAKTTKI